MNEINIVSLLSSLMLSLMMFFLGVWLHSIMLPNIQPSFFCSSPVQHECIPQEKSGMGKMIVFVLWTL